MKHLGLAILALTGCGFSASLEPAVRCTSDAQCESTQVCFATGCGDPGTGIVVEVTGNGLSLHPQDIAITDLTANLPLDIRAPLSIAGTLRQDKPDQSGVQDFSGPVTITARGQSQLIPGLSRTYSLVMPKVDHGGYELYVGAGIYSVTAKPSYPGIPYQTIKGVTVVPGEQSGGASFTFPAVNETLYLTGQLLARVEPGRPEHLVYQPGMTIQALESLGGTALSQVTDVSSTGVFTLALDYSAAQLSAITLVAMPADNTALVPTKIFVLSPVPAVSNIGRLELGDFGTPLPMVPGKLLSASGAPIANASITLEGRVGGGGSFKSRTATTNGDGAFTVDLLPSPADAAYTLTAIPPPESNSGILQVLVHAGLVNGVPAFTTTADATTAKLEFSCPDRLVATGTVTNPDGSAAQSMKIVATPIEALTGRPLPTEATTGYTDLNGRYTFVLDPAKYRFDYVPVPYPRKSRLVRIEPSVDVDAGTLVQTMDLGEFQLSVGRTVTGQVTVRPNPNGTADQALPAANALVHFYRVTSVEGASSALLIGESIADQNGKYTVVLPDHPTAPASP